MPILLRSLDPTYDLCGTHIRGVASNRNAPRDCPLSFLDTVRLQQEHSSTSSLITLGLSALCGVYFPKNCKTATVSPRVTPKALPAMLEVTLLKSRAVPFPAPCASHVSQDIIYFRRPSYVAARERGERDLRQDEPPPLARGEVHRINLSTASPVPGEHRCGLRNRKSSLSMLS